MRRPLAALATLLATAILLAVPASAEDLRFLRIGTGATGETHFPIGGLIANAISNPPGSRPCDRGGSCGVEGLIAVAQSTHGSLDNVQRIAAGRLEAALVQADIAYWAYHGTGVYQDLGAVENLRAVATIYTDSVHLVARADSGIGSIRDLKGKRVSLGDKGSGTLVDSRIILDAFGIAEKDLRVSHLRSGPAADAMRRGEIDAFFVIDGAPAPVVAALARDLPIRLVPIAGPKADKLRQRFPFFVPGEVNSGIYAGIDGPVTTLDLGVALVIDAGVDSELVYGLTRALWHPSTRRLLATGHPRGRPVRLAAGLDGLGIPLHGGAASYYFDAGIGH